MATTTLTNGIKIPERASRDWYSDLSVNWNLLDNHLGDTDSHLDDGLAPKATADASGNTITSTYATKTELSTLSTTVGTKADDSDVVHKADAETITGAKTFSATVTSADVVPSATNTYSLGSASVQYNGIYGKTYYYNGVQWGLDKANTWTNTNTFQQNITYERTNFFHQASNPCYFLKDTALEKGSLASTAHSAYAGNWQDKNSANLGYMRFVEYDTGKQTAEFRISNLIKDGALDPTGSAVNCTVLLELQPSGEKSFSPELNNDINLGTSSYKWKTLNGVNPGALSLPNVNSYSVITSDFRANIDKTQTTFSWTSPYTGWLYVLWLTQNATAPFWVNVWTPVPDGSTALNKSAWGQCFSQASYVYYFPTCIPVVAGATYYFNRNWVRSTNDSTTDEVVQGAVFLPSLGNV